MLIFMKSQCFKLSEIFFFSNLLFSFSFLFFSVLEHFINQRNDRSIGALQTIR